MSHRAKHEPDHNEKSAEPEKENAGGDDHLGAAVHGLVVDDHRQRDGGQHQTADQELVPHLAQMLAH